MGCPTCQELQRQNDELRYQIDSLKSELTRDITVEGLRPAEVQVCKLLRLRSPNPVAKWQLANMMFGLRPEIDWPNEKIFDVYVCRARQALDPEGVKIETVRGVGWYMTSESAENWDKLIQTDEVRS